MYPSVSRIPLCFLIDGDKLDSRNIASDCSFQSFCELLQELYNGGGETFDIGAFEYTLIEKRFHRGEIVERLSDADAYYHMVDKYLTTPTHWRYALVQKSKVSRFRKCFLGLQKLTCSS